jgi:hypothetical protein
MQLPSVQYVFHQPYILQLYIIADMFENIAYVGLGFIAVFLGLELAWHFTACKIHDKSIKPCIYKQIRVLEWKSNMLVIAIIVGIVFVCALFVLPLHESLASPR